MTFEKWVEETSKSTYLGADQAPRNKDWFIGMAEEEEEEIEASGKIK
jgi:hypothetical protein